MLPGKLHVKQLVALEPQDISTHHREQKDVEENFWSMLNTVIPTVSLLLGMELEMSLHHFLTFTFVLNAALLFTGFNEICHFLRDAALIIGVFKLQ